MAGVRHVDHGEAVVTAHPGDGPVRRRVALHSMNQQDGALHSGPIVPQVETAPGLGAVGEQCTQVMPVDPPPLLIRPAGAVVGAVEQDRVRGWPGVLLGCAIRARPDPDR